MINDNSPVTEDELHAYVDGELPADRRHAVEAWLATHPEDAARVAAWRAQADALRARFGGIAEQQVPARLKLEAHDALTPLVGRDWRPARRSPRSWSAASPAGWCAAHPPPRPAVSSCSPPRRSARTSSISARCAIRSRSRQKRTIWYHGCRDGSAPICARPTWRVSDSSSSAGGCCPDPMARPRCSCMKARPASASRSTARSCRCRRRRSATPSPTVSPPFTGSRARSALW